MNHRFQRYVVRPFEILLKCPLRFALGRLFPSKSPRVFYGYERIPSRNEPASGGIVKLQDLSEVYPNCRWRANTLYLISSCYPWTVRWQVRVARFFGAKIILNQNGVAYPAWKPEGWEIENERAAWVHRRADAVVYQAGFCRRCALEWLKVEEPEYSRVLLNPVDVHAFGPSAEGRSAEGTYDGSGRIPFRILLAGSHQFAYRVRTALEALAKLDEEYRMIVAGAYNWGESQEDALAEARGWAVDLGVSDRVDFQGRYLQSEAPALFAQAEVLLHTKVMDPCPRLVAEGLASGLPVVYAGSGGLPEMVSSEAGVAVESVEDFERERPADPKQFAEAIRKVRAEYTLFREGARRCAEERFNRDEWLKAHGELIRTVRAQL
ncbi:glycosyltransferase family 4 protein [Puniceicoccus vermicola]|uniref:Glycosyltransferase family 4 protein n=1 Tax=Puniceicoccus vermicola TaxID=388746 RepID=A0A7X1E3I6_9BACT|nr:glycosyltransferase family 4 protein [Puniceicoccus vermicola]MBC2601101.1 glycosyltransferase family 4 protein [Puniceicoccus vermicola]